MALSPRLDLRQSQQLVMTPQLQQAIKLLQLSNLELVDYVTEEVERNPLLEFGEAGGEGSGDGVGDGSAAGAADGLGGMDRLSDAGEDAGPLRELASDDGDRGEGLIAADHSLSNEGDLSGTSDGALDANVDDNVFNNDAVSDRIDPNQQVGSDRGLSLEGIGGGRGLPDDRGIDQTLESTEDLKTYVDQQVAMEFAHADKKLIASHFVDMLNEAGYVPDTACDDITERLGADPDMVHEVLMRLQSFEPVGIFARDLAECLGIQLLDKDRLDPAMQAFLDNLPLMAKGDLVGLKRCCGVDDEDLAEMVQEIKALNPKPGLAFGSESVQPVVPDIFITKSRAGVWTVELNSDTLPKVLMNSQYLSELQSVGGDKEAKTFISDCVSGANWLVKALDQRARTILKVSTALVQRQEGFFEHGIRHMKPLTLKDVADEIDMHESTVSRVTSNKFMACPRGVFELKYFFTSSISSADGSDAHSAEAVRYRIKELIDAEDPKKILSDDKIVAMMRDDGIDIARRTVAKYREAMKIPSSVQRRRQKNM